jgi:hypothetical protein
MEPLLPEVLAKETRPGVQRRLDLQPAFAASENFPESGSRSNRPSRVARGRPAAPDVDRDAAEVDQRELRLELAANDVVRRALLVLDRLRRRAVRHSRRLFLLDEALLEDPVRGPLERQQPVLHVGTQLRKNEVVEPGEVELRVSLLRPEHLVWVGEKQRCLPPLPPGEGRGEGVTSCYRFWISEFGFDRERSSSGLFFTFRQDDSDGFLVVAQAEIDGWRSRSSDVHSW